MRRILLILLFIYSALSSFAQNTGFAGKRLVMKLDAYNTYVNRFPNIGAEVIISRTLTLSAELNMGNQRIKQKYFWPVSDAYNYNAFKSKYHRRAMPEKAEVSQQSVVLSFRKYLVNKHVETAPNGPFFSLGYRIGKIKNIQGSFNETVFFQYNRISSNAGIIEYEAENISFHSIQAGFGRQWFLNPRLSIDFLLGAAYSRFKAELGEEGNRILSGVTGNFGYNVLRIYSTKDSKQMSAGNVGVFLNLSVGYSIF